MADLAEIERLEYLAIDLLAKAMPPASRRNLTAALDSLRATKRKMLAANPSVLRKLHTDPAPKDAPNAPMPMADGSLGSSVEEKLFRAPSELAGMSIHTCRGQIQVPPHGVVHTNAAHEDLHRELKGRGFRELHAIDAVGKNSTAAVHMFRHDRLPLIGENDDFFRALHRRADVTPAEQRFEQLDGPGPAPTYCRSASEFRQSYFGERS